MKFLDRVARRLGYLPQGKRNLFVAAIQNRLTADWNPYQASPTMELSGGLLMLRQRARDLERNNPLVRRYLHLVAENVVGHRGIRLQARNMAGDHLNQQANDALEAAFCDWHRPEYCTVEGNLSWVGFQQQTIKTVARDGEAFIRLVRSSDYGLALQMIDADLVDESYNTSTGEHGFPVRLGVEVDGWGKPRGYYVFTEHHYDPTAKQRARMFVPADEMLHLFIPRRPGQTRGESWLAPVLLPLKMLDGYAEAELVAARTAAAKQGFIIPGEDSDGPDPNDSSPTQMDASPGSIDRLGKGETFMGWDPSHPSGNFQSFVVQITKLIAGGLNVAYASLSGDLREVNYSSIRAGLLQERDNWRSLQVWQSDHLNEPVYRVWRDVAWRKGHLALRMPPSEYADHVWRPRGWAWVDPQKDILAAGLAVALGFTSRTRVVADDGEEFEDILAEQKSEQELAEAYDVDLMLPTGVSNGEGTGDNADPAADGGVDGGTSSGGRAYPRVALLRSAR